MLARGLFPLDGVYHQCSFVPNALLSQTVLDLAIYIVPDNFEGSGGTETPISGFTQPKQVMLGGIPYVFSKLSTVMILSFRTDMSGQIVQTQIRL